MTIIVADTTCSLPREWLASRGIPLIPQDIIFGDESFHDDSELDTPTFLRKLGSSSALPKTAAPEPPLYHPIFRFAQEKGESLVVVAPTSKASGTFRSAEIAAQDFPQVDIRVVDTLTIAGNLGSLVLMADRWAKAGAGADEVVRRLNEMIPRGRIYFLVNTLEYLQKGGRIGGARALVGELLQVKPILTIRDGQVEPFEQQRTKKRALARLVEIVKEQCPKTDQAHLCVMQAGAFDEGRELAARLQSEIGGGEIPIYELPPAIVVHAGPGALAVGFFI
ncbi:MAG TPA: DegV family protein [Anaerolineales bacterium]|nr:DegV family protein [Anaerolineales bacterium]